MTERLEPGFLGISKGDLTLNAICIGKSGQPYMFTVDEDTADRLIDWAYSDTEDLEDILPDASEYTLDLFEDGTEATEDDYMVDQLVLNLQPTENS